MDDHGIIVAGGGPVGSAAALALAAAGRTVTLLEARGDAAEDPRALALAWGSRLVLERLGAWPPAGAVPIHHIDVSQRGGCGRVELTAAEAGVAALGYVVDYGALQRALTCALAASGAHVETGCVARAVAGDRAQATVTVEQAAARRELRGSLAVIADGGAGLELAPVRTHDYGQSALVCDVVSDEPHRNRAFERFTAEGPLALLPATRGWSLVWTARTEHAAALAALEPAAFCARLAETFGSRLGSFRLGGRRQTFALRLKVAQRPPASRCVLIGNAAQTLHPVAGQGFNLGLRDAYELARVIGPPAAGDPGADSLLKNFLAQRRLDRTATILFTDSLIRLFSKDIPLLAPARGLALAALSALPAARKFLARRMMFGARG